jgi:type IV pilus assembly protein PilO
VSALKKLKTRAATGNGAIWTRDWLNPLNLHWAGVAVIALVNVGLLAQMAFLWHASSNYNADAMAQQRIELKAAEIAAIPLRGLDAKLPRATADADAFSRQRLPATDSEMLSELGALTKKAGVRLLREQYVHAAVLGGSQGELTEVRMDASLSGDYRPLVIFINSLERDKMFFVIAGVTLSGQQSGTVNLRMRLATYLRSGVMQERAADEAAAGTNAAAAAPTRGPAR